MYRIEAYIQFLLCVEICSGLSVKISGPLSYAVLNEKFTFTCSVSQAADLSDTVKFYKIEGKKKDIGSLYQTGDSCSLFGRTPGYTPVCGEGTDVGSSSVKNYTLTINRTSADDETLWWCQLTTALNKSNNFTLPVYYGPDSVTLSLTSPVEVVEGRNLSVDCVAVCKPSCSYSWKLGNDELTSNSQLRLTNISRNETGNVYTCTVTNSETKQSESNTVTMTVFYPPSSSPVVSGTTFPVFEGDTVTLSCSTTGGNPKPNLNWTCYNPVHCSDRGETRTCKISFIANRTHNNKLCVCTPTWKYDGYTENKSVNMTIYYPPSQPSLYSNPTQPWLEGEAGSLICSLPESDLGNPPAKLNWIKNEHKITFVGSNFSFTPTKEDNRDKYKCTAENLFTDRPDQSKPESNVLQVSVYYYPRIQISLSQSNPVKEGDDLTLTCRADSNPSSVQLKWKFEGNIQVNNGILNLKNLSRDNSGSYTCEANVRTSIHGDLLNSSETEVNVNYAPDVSFPSENLTENMLLKINCSADGRPDNMNFSDFKHYWNDVFVRKVTGRHVGRNKYSLMFVSASYQDSGTYQCSVHNGIPDRSGTLEQTGYNVVYVKAKPKITLETKHDIVGAEIGKPVVLVKTLFCDPTMNNYTWMKSDSETSFNNTNVEETNVTLKIHGKLIKDSGYRISLNITNFTQDDTGTYKLTVCNEVGCSHFSVNLTAAGPPLPPKEFQQERESTSDTVFLSWLPNYPGGNFKQRFILQYKPQSDSNWITARESKWFDDSTQGQKFFFNITNLKDKTVYDVRISAENNRTSNNMSDYVTIQVTTKASEEHSSTSSALGAAVGGALGSVTVIVVIVTLIVLLRRGILPGLSTKQRKVAEHALQANGNAECVLPVLEDNELYYMHHDDRLKNQVLPVLEDNDLYYTSKDNNLNKSKPSGERGQTESASEKKKKDKQDFKLKKMEKEKKKKEKDAEKKVKDGHKGDVYENVDAVREDVTYANAVFEGEGATGQDIQGAKHGRDEDGLLYVGIDFSNTQPSKQVHKTQDKVEYVYIDWNKKAEPLPNEDDRETEPKIEK